MTYPTNIQEIEEAEFYPESEFTMSYRQSSREESERQAERNVRIREALGRRCWVVVSEFTTYCRVTDAITGTGRAFERSFYSKHEAEAYCSRLNNDPELSAEGEISHVVLDPPAGHCTGHAVLDEPKRLPRGRHCDDTEARVQAFDWDSECESWN